MDEPIRQRIEEFFLEIQLSTNSQFLVVEGESDRRFFKLWEKELLHPKNLRILVVNEIDIPYETIKPLNLTEGNRSRVIALAKEAFKENVNIRCVADRDTGIAVNNHSYPQLIWTDYPSIESYAVSMEILERANIAYFKELLPEVRSYFPEFTIALKELFVIRSNFPSIQEPNIKKGLLNKRSFRDFDVTKTVNPDIRDLVGSFERPSDPNPKTYAYGHDIASLLISAFGNDLKNKVGLSSTETIEDCLKSSLLAVGAYKQDHLFKNLFAWLGAKYVSEIA